ncbi:unnamed protein product, partial [Adineta steineri]
TGTQREEKIRINSEKLPSLIDSFEHPVQEGIYSRKQDKKYQQQSIVNGHD